MGEAKGIKTSILFRDDLWQRAKIQAAIDRKDLADIVNNALEAYLQPKPKTKKAKAKKGGTDAR